MSDLSGLWRGANFRDIYGGITAASSISSSADPLDSESPFPLASTKACDGGVIRTTL